MRLSVGGLVPVLLLSGMPALADGVDELIVTGTRLAAEADKLPNASTVIDRGEIEARGDTGVVDLLRAIPGVQVVQPGAGGVPQLFMRGGEPNFTVFLVDGIKVNDSNNTRGGSFDLPSLNLVDIERVEIVRGPQSSIYGSDGLTGVINFISPSGGGPFAATVEGETGTDDFARGSVLLQGPAGDGGFSLQLTSRDDGEAVEGSTYEADTVNGRLRFAPAGGVGGNLYARYANTDSTSFPEQSGGPEFAVYSTLDHASADDLTVGGDLSWDLTDTLSLQGLASHYDRSSSYASPGIAPGDLVPPNGADSDLTRDNASVRLTARRGDWLAGTAGIDFQRESGRSDGYVDFAPDLRVPNSFSLDRDIVGVFAEARLRPSAAWLLQGSLRHDEPDEVSGETTGRVGVAYSPNDGATLLRANWGTGFKLPSFFALGSPLVGNPDLKPEKSRSVDIGVTQRLGDGGEISVTVFDNDYDDFVDFDADTFSSVNRDFTARGVELGGSWAATPTLGLRAHATWTDIDVKSIGRELLQRPDWRGGAELQWRPAQAWSLDLDWLYVGEVLDNAIPTGQQTLSSYNRVDLNLGWQASARLRVALSVDNLLDGEYEEAIGFPASGIRPRVSARYSFGG